MSFSQAQVDALSAADVTNPSTGKAFTADELTTAGTSPAKNEETLMSQLKNHAQVNVALMNHVTDGAKTNYAKRIKGLVEDKTITKDYAEKSLAPLLDGFQMSFGDDGSFKPHALDHALNALEATNAGMKKSALGTVLDLGGQGTMQNSTMDVLNALAMSQNGGLPAGLNLEGGSLPDGNGAISEDDADKIAKSFLENTGHVTVGN